MRKVIIFTLFGLLAACQEKSLAPATYDPPVGFQAFNAVKAGLKTDHIDAPYKINRLNREARNPGEKMQEFDNSVKRINNNGLQKMYKTLKQLENLECEWVKVAAKHVPERAKARLTEQPKAAYKCSFGLRYKPDPRLGELMAPTITGYFFKQDGVYVYAGPYKHPY